MSLAAVDRAIELGYADPDRLGVGGYSYGGILTNYIITQTDRFKGAVSGAGSALWRSPVTATIFISIGTKSESGPALGIARIMGSPLTL